MAGPLYGAHLSQHVRMGEEGSITALTDVTATQDTLTDSTTGTANTTLVKAVTEGGAATITAGDAAKIDDNFADLAAQNAKVKVDVAAVITNQNVIINALQAAGIMPAS